MTFGGSNESGAKETPPLPHSHCCFFSFACSFQVSVVSFLGFATTSEVSFMKINKKNRALVMNTQCHCVTKSTRNTLMHF